MQRRNRIHILALGAVLGLGFAPSIARAAVSIPQEPQRSQVLSEREKIAALIEHVRDLEGAIFIRNDDEHSAPEAAEHMETKLDFAGSRIRTAEQFIEHIASKSSISGRSYIIRFADGREVKSGEYLREQLKQIEASANEDEAVKQPAAQSDGDTPLRHLDPLMGEWTGTLSGEGPDGSAYSIPIRWKTTRVFDGRWIRFEFTSVEPVVAGPPARWVEWEGLFTENPETGEIESVWMTPRLRQVAGESRFLDGRYIFFEKGRFDETGRVLTLIAHKQNEGPDKPIIEVKSTFTIAEDGQSFKVVDEEKQEDGTWKTSGVFELERADDGAKE